MKINREFPQVTLEFDRDPDSIANLEIITDDGKSIKESTLRAYITRNGGGDWREITPEGMGEWPLISLIEASPHDERTAYLALSPEQQRELIRYLKTLRTPERPNEELVRRRSLDLERRGDTRVVSVSCETPGASLGLRWSRPDHEPDGLARPELHADAASSLGRRPAAGWQVVERARQRDSHGHLEDGLLFSCQRGARSGVNKSGTS